MAKKPLYKVGQKVKATGIEGKVIRVWASAPECYRYSIKTAKGKIALDEDELSPG